ncbi:hypothetical protein ACFRMQ_06120 [Kitasatospora sp. NPDC056783]|uniref:hypothetical protein n=1 Tax=Kitasatospora sp. NPDC056783 TaxID=3345943 RepID=UPI0036B2BFC7
MAVAKKTTAPKTAAAKAEATETPSTFEHAGVTFTIPTPKDLPLALLEVQDELEAVRLIVGKGSWAEYWATEPTIGDFQELSDKINQAQAGQGN